MRSVGSQTTALYRFHYRARMLGRSHAYVPLSRPDTATHYSSKPVGLHRLVVTISHIPDLQKRRDLRIAVETTGTVVSVPSGHELTSLRVRRRARTPHTPIVFQRASCLHAVLISRT